MNRRGISEFFVWTKDKIKHHFKKIEKKKVYFREKEIWWVALGKNVGLEINGKHDLFERPVLIIKKYNQHTCFVLPLTTQIKEPLPWYQIVIDFDLKRSAINITQGRVISSRRLLRKEAVSDREVYNKIVKAFRSQFK